MEEVHAIRGTPSRPNPSNSDPRIPVRVRTPENPISRPQENAPAPRGIRTERRDFEKHGYTEGCEGCIRMKHGGKRRSHSAKCRDRMMKAMNEDEEDRERIKKREEDINEHVAR